MQTTLEVLPVFEYPVLQMHTTAFVVESCEQVALGSQPPLLTRHVSTNIQRGKDGGKGVRIGSRGRLMSNDRLFRNPSESGRTGV